MLSIALDKRELDRDDPQLDVLPERERLPKVPLLPAAPLLVPSGFPAWR